MGARRVEVPLLHGLPNPMIGNTGDLYTSLASFLCPEDCSEPLHCSVTGEHRSKPLSRILMNLSGPFESKVIHSHQLGQGGGGFRLERLLNLTKELKERKDKEQLILAGTACRCHGVTSALSFRHRGQREDFNSTTSTSRSGKIWKENARKSIKM